MRKFTALVASLALSAIGATAANATALGFDDSSATQISLSSNSYDYVVFNGTSYASGQAAVAAKGAPVTFSASYTGGSGASTDAGTIFYVLPDSANILAEIVYNFASSGGISTISGTFYGAGSTFDSIDATPGAIISTLNAPVAGVATGLQFVGINGLYVTLAAADAAPEPASWAMMLIGFGAIGAGLRGRRRIDQLV